MSFDAHQTFVAPSLEEIARLFPAYQVECLVAQGGMGAVYKARQKSLDRDVALKILPREFGADPAFRSSFEAEAKAMARLNHPNLISVYDFGEADGLLYIIMEFVPGKSLFHSAHGIAIDPREAGRIIASVCDGLAHAHEHGILHRDIKPANILLTPKAEPKIGDFGLARPVGRQHNAGETVFGTPHYTAPEVVSHPSRVDTRADVFSVGVMFHELLTGKLPSDDPRAPSAISKCDPRFDTIIRRATHPVPEMRYSDAATMAREIQALTEALAGPKLRAVATTPRRFTPPSHTTRNLSVAVRKPSPAKGSPVAIILGIFAVVAVIVAAIIVLNRPPTVPKKVNNDIPPIPPPQKPVQPSIVRQPGQPGGQVHDTPKPKPLENPMPEPEPPPVTNKDPEPDTPAVKPEVEPGSAVNPAKPLFNSTAWLDDTARRVMRDKAAPMLEHHREMLERNLDAFQRRVDRLIRRLDRSTRENVEDNSNEFFDELRDKGNRIPTKEGLAVLTKGKDQAFSRAAEAEHGEALAKQVEIDATLAAALYTLQQSYLKGIELQIQRLNGQNDKAAAEILLAEVSATREQEKRFERVMRGLPPEEPKPEVPKDGKGKVDPKADPKAEPKADPKAEPKADPKADPKAEPNPKDTKEPVPGAETKPDLPKPDFGP